MLFLFLCILKRNSNAFYIHLSRHSLQVRVCLHKPGHPGSLAGFPLLPGLFIFFLPINLLFFLPSSMGAIRSQLRRSGVVLKAQRDKDVHGY